MFAGIVFVFWIMFWDVFYIMIFISTIIVDIHVDIHMYYKIPMCHSYITCVYTSNNVDIPVAYHICTNYGMRIRKKTAMWALGLRKLGL